MKRTCLNLAWSLADLSLLALFPYISNRPASGLTHPRITIVEVSQKHNPALETIFNMSGTEPNTKNKLRAACDRCHELKNRCMRTRGPDARCDRCERLDIDCVYGVGARMGRPRIQRADKGKSGSKRSTAGDSSKKSSSKRKAEGPERQEEGEPDRKEQIEKIQETEHYVFDSSHSMIHLTDPSLLPEGTASPFGMQVFASSRDVVLTIGRDAHTRRHGHALLLARSAISANRKSYGRTR